MATKHSQLKNSKKLSSAILKPSRLTPMITVTFPIEPHPTTILISFFTAFLIVNLATISSLTSQKHSEEKP